MKFFPSLRRRESRPKPEPQPAVGLNADYYNPDVVFGSIEGSPPAHLRRESRKHRRGLSPGAGPQDDYPPRHSRGHREPRLRHMKDAPPIYFAPDPPRPEYRRDRDSSGRDRHRDRKGDRDYRDRHEYDRDPYERRSRQYCAPLEPRESRRGSYPRDRSFERDGPRSKHHSPRSRSRSRGFRSAPHNEGDGRYHRSGHRSRGLSPSPVNYSRGGLGYESDDHGPRRRRHRSQPRDTHRSLEAKGHSRSRGRDVPTTRQPPRRRNTMPLLPPKPAVVLSKAFLNSEWWKHPTVQAGARTALTAGAQALMKHRKEKGDWFGSKGAKVATAALSAALADGFGGGGEK